VGGIGGRRARSAVVAVVAVASLSAVVACTSGDDAAGRRSSTTATTTSAPTPSTVSDADFESQATTAELMIRNAGKDPCAVIKAFPLSSNLPTPVNPGQVERAVKVVAQLFDAIGSSAPAESAADAAVLKQAAADLLAEGEANHWQPTWLMSTPKSIGDATVTQAFANYQATVNRSCTTQTTTTTTSTATTSTTPTTPSTAITPTTAAPR